MVKDETRTGSNSIFVTLVSVLQNGELFVEEEQCAYSRAAQCIAQQRPGCTEVSLE